MYESLEKLIRKDDLGITIMEERYGDGILFGLDMPVRSIADPDQPLHDLIDQATSPGDVDAIEALCGLEELAEEYPALLYTQAATLEEGLEKLEKKAERWDCLSCEEQECILEKVNEFYSKVFVSRLDYLLSQSNAYEVHHLQISGCLDTGPLLEVTTETDFQYDFKIGQELMVVTDSKRTFQGSLSFFSAETLKIRQNERIEVCIPFEAITHVIDYGIKEEVER